MRGVGEPFARPLARQPQPVPAAQHVAVIGVAVLQQRTHVRARARPRERRAVGAAPQRDLASEDRAHRRTPRDDVRARRRDVPATRVLGEGARQHPLDAGHRGLTPRRADLLLWRLRDASDRVAPRDLGTQLGAVAGRASHPRLLRRVSVGEGVRWVEPVSIVGCASLMTRTTSRPAGPPRPMTRARPAPQFGRVR